jgi:CubicO group peptidase (beta-lactamase class C family)
MTKPIVSVAAMTLVEEGRLMLAAPLSEFIPEFGTANVGVLRSDDIDLVPLARPVTVQDVMRHTSGLTYGFSGDTAVHRFYRAPALFAGNPSTADFAARLAALPLVHQPGARWEYSFSTDALGRVIEVVAGRRLGDVLDERVFAPLGMRDTAFYAPPEKRGRLAEAHSWRTMTAAGIPVLDVAAPPRLGAGGSGLYSTMADYGRFADMLAGRGAFQGVRILSPRTLAFMTSDHLGPGAAAESVLLPPGHGFGLGFAVRLADGLGPTPGSVGEFFWGGAAGTLFFISPRDSLAAIMLLQAPDFRDHMRCLFRALVYSALDA